MRRLLLAVPLLLGFVQDEAAIRDLIRKLDDTDLEVRESALAKLVQAGPPALEPLRQASKSESAEVRIRAAQAIRAIEVHVRTREIYPAFKPLGLKRSATVGELLDDLAARTGTKFEATAEQRKLKASVDAASLFQALDQICGGQEKLSYSFDEGGAIKLTGDVHLATPTWYFEAFKVYLTDFVVVRRTDFKEATLAAQISISTAWEGKLKPLRRVRFEITEAKDDAGRDLTAVGGYQVRKPLGRGIGGFGGGPGGPADPFSSPLSYDLRGLAPESKSLASLKGRAIVTFPLTPVPVEFENPASGASQTVGDIAIKIKEIYITSNRIVVAVSRARGESALLLDEVFGRLEAGGIVAVDETGKAHVGEIHQAPNTGGWPREEFPAITFQAKFPDLDQKDIKCIKIRIADTMIEKSVPFEIKDLKFP